LELTKLGNLEREISWVTCNQRRDIGSDIISVALEDSGEKKTLPIKYL